MKNWTIKNSVVGDVHVTPVSWGTKTHQFCIKLCRMELFFAENRAKLQTNFVRNLPPLLTPTPTLPGFPPTFLDIYRNKDFQMRYCMKFHLKVHQKYQKYHLKAFKSE